MTIILLSFFEIRKKYIFNVNNFFVVVFKEIFQQKVWVKNSLLVEKFFFNKKNLKKKDFSLLKKIGEKTGSERKIW